MLDWGFPCRKMVAEDYKIIYRRILLLAMEVPNVREVRWRFCQAGNHVFFKMTNEKFKAPRCIICGCEYITKLF
jgi:hypothetical protein